MNVILSAFSNRDENKTYQRNGERGEESHTQIIHEREVKDELLLMGNGRMWKDFFLHIGTFYIAVVL